MVEKVSNRDAIILASRDQSTTYSGKNIKYLLEVGGIPIIQQLIDQIEQSVLERITIVGDQSVIQPFLKKTEKQYLFAKPGNSLVCT